MNLKKLTDAVVFFLASLFIFIVLRLLSNQIFHISNQTLVILTLLFISLSRAWIVRFAQDQVFVRIRPDFASDLQRLEQLNSRLNQARRFREVTRLLFNTFDGLFKDHRFAFYILEDNRFTLAHAGNLSRQDLPPAVHAAAFAKVDLDTLLIENFRDVKLRPQIQQQFTAHGLQRIHPFKGHSRIFAFLIMDAVHCSIFTYQQTRELFNKIQKKAGLILENTALIIDLERRHKEIREIIAVSQRILSSFDMKNILDFILKSLKEVMDFDAAAIFLLDSSGKRLLSVSSMGYREKVINDLRLKVGQGACGWVVESKKTSLLSDVSTSPHYYQVRTETKSQLSLPVIFNNQILGVICLESDQKGFFTRSQAETLQIFADLAAIAIHNSKQLDILIAKKSLERELVNAASVQQRLLVRHPPHYEDLKIIAYNRPSSIVSGDLYDLIRYNDHTLGIAIGDVSGKGAAAALMMALILAGLRSHSKTFMTACDVVYRLNNLLAESTIEGLYATFFYGILNLQTGRIIYTNAGHNPPILIKASGEIIRLTEGGIVLGFMPDWEYKQAELDFDSGDILIGYTDGITESMNEQGEEFGEQRLIDLIISNRGLNIYKLKDKILEELHTFSGEKMSRDDITLILIEKK